MSVTTILLIFAFICFICDAFAIGRGSSRMPSLTPLGLALWVMAVMLGYLR